MLNLSPFIDRNFPGFSFKTEPQDCLTLEEIWNLEKRLGGDALPAVFKQREAEYKTCGPRYVDDLGVVKMQSAKRLLCHLHLEHEYFSKNRAMGASDNEQKMKSFSESNLLHLIYSADGNEDSFEHSLLVTRYALLLSKALGADDREFILTVERGAILHDIGKIGIPEYILKKAGKLSLRESAVVQDHPLLGYELIEEYDFLKKAARIVLFHHESYDGSGYPYGLKEKEIPLEARLFAVVDTLDAVTSDRPYRKGQSFSVARQEIENGRGIQFDPEVVDGFLSVPEDYWKKLRERHAFYRLDTVH
ncbi:MAG: HD domain-containing protein [Candidatus Aminicenantes bacterium]|jgi:putative nucleotidyltransferase with HDIG domain